MQRRIRQLATLRWREWAVLFQLVPATVAVATASRFTPLDRLVARLGRRTTDACARPQALLPLFHGRLSESELYRLSDWATRLTAGDRRCLQRSLLLHWLLSRRDQASTIELGVGLRDDELLSHAWVTVAGKPVGETGSSLAPFRTILRLGPR